MEWNEIAAAIDGSVDRKTETMCAGFVTFVAGSCLQPGENLSFPVGGPLSFPVGGPLASQAAGLDCLLDRTEQDRPLLVFADRLVLSPDSTVLVGASRLLARSRRCQTLRCNHFVTEEAPVTDRAHLPQAGRSQIPGGQIKCFSRARPSRIGLRSSKK